MNEHLHGIIKILAEIAVEQYLSEQSLKSANSGSRPRISFGEQLKPKDEKP